MASKFLHEYKLVLFGAGGVGKTSLTSGFLQNQFIDKYDPTLEASGNRYDEVGLLDVLDTAGQEEYSAMREQIMRTGDGFLIVYSITSRDSFEETKVFQKQILEAKKKDGWPMTLVANKDDLFSERTVSKKEGEELAMSFGCSFLETSAKTRHNVDEAFFDIVRAIRDHSKILTHEEDITAGNEKAAARSMPNKVSDKAPYNCCGGCSVI